MEYFCQVTMLPWLSCFKREQGLFGSERQGRGWDGWQRSQIYMPRRLVNFLPPPSPQDVSSFCHNHQRGWCIYLGSTFNLFLHAGYWMLIYLLQSGTENFTKMNTQPKPRTSESDQQCKRGTKLDTWTYIWKQFKTQAEQDFEYICRCHSQKYVRRYCNLKNQCDTPSSYQYYSQELKGRSPSVHPHMNE